MEWFVMVGIYNKLFKKNEAPKYRTCVDESRAFPPKFLAYIDSDRYIPAGQNGRLMFCYPSVDFEFSDQGISS
jgi:hypothetical protein